MMQTEEISKKFNSEMIGIIPTDTIYGVAASAFSKKAVERAYKVLKRNPKKPFIVLISSLNDLSLFKIKIDSKTQKILHTLWLDKISVILPISKQKLRYLHRGIGSLAFRMPKKPSLQKLLKKTGPLISTSANPEGAKPAETIAEAKKYFGNRIDFYADGGKIKSLPSTLVEIKEGRIRVIRKGAVKINFK